MPEKNERAAPGPIAEQVAETAEKFKESVCVHTKKIYDACRDKDCLEDMRVFLTRCSQQVVDRAINVKARKAELLWVFIDVEAVPFNRGFYTCDVRYFYKITADAFVGVGRPQEVSGLASFDKRVILFGSEGNAKIFSSNTAVNGIDEQSIRSTNMPSCIVEVVDPIVLSVKLVDVCDCRRHDDICEVPSFVERAFEEELVLTGDEKRLYCTLGQFSIIRLERDTQLIIPAYDFCMPEKECVGSSEDNPCNLFRKIRFPVDEFFPPNYQPNETGELNELRKQCES